MEMQEKLDSRLPFGTRNRIAAAVLTCRDYFGEMKYRNESHFVRVAVLSLLRSEEQKKVGARAGRFPRRVQYQKRGTEHG